MLASLLIPWSGASAAVGTYTGRPILILVVPAGMILGYAARGIGKGLEQGLEIGVRKKVLEWMGVEEDPKDD